MNVLYNNATNNAVLKGDIETLYIGKSNSFAYANVTCILCHLLSSLLCPSSFIPPETMRFLQS